MAFARMAAPHCLRYPDPCHELFPDAVPVAFYDPFCQRVSVEHAEIHRRQLCRSNDGLCGAILLRATKAESLIVDIEKCPKERA